MRQRIIKKNLGSTQSVIVTVCPSLCHPLSITWSNFLCLYLPVCTFLSVLLSVLLCLSVYPSLSFCRSFCMSIFLCSVSSHTHLCVFFFSLLFLSVPLRHSVCLPVSALSLNSHSIPLCQLIFPSVHLCVIISVSMPVFVALSLPLSLSVPL